MADEKKFSAQEAALAVLKKAEEILAKAAKSKSYMPNKVSSTGPEFENYTFQSGVHAPHSQKAVSDAVHAGRKDVKSGMGSKEAVKESHKAKLAELKAMPKPELKSEEANPDQAADAKLGEEVAHKVADHIAADPASHEDLLSGMKGHIKLAKFMGRMEHKRSMRAEDQKMSPEAEMDKSTGHEKGVHTHNHEGPGNSPAGSFSSAAVKGNTSLPKQELNSAAKDEHKKVLSEQKAMPKPKLPG